MSKKKNKFFHHNYWQSNAYNQQLFIAFRTQIINLALTRFKWVNLPATCDARFIEWTLLFNGIATIAKPKNKNAWYSTQATINGHINVYDNPVSWKSFGNNGWMFDVTPQNGVLVYDNLARQPIMPILDIYARDLVDIMRTKQLNRQHQKMPFILTGSQDQKLDMTNLYKQIDGGEPAIIATDALNTIEFKALNTGVNYLGEQLQNELNNVWRLIYTVLGIENIPLKSERQVENEVNINAEPADKHALSPLMARREACKRLNNRFEPFLTEPISVVWREDVLSNNYNYVTSIEKQEEVN